MYQYKWYKNIAFKVSWTPELQIRKTNHATVLSNVIHYKK